METNNKTPIVTGLQKLIAVYKLLISPLLGSRCRFTPSCSEYAHQAIEQHGVIKGLYYSVKRILRCHPWGESGYDPVPEKNHCNCSNQSTVVNSNTIKEVNN